MSDDDVVGVADDEATPLDLDDALPEEEVSDEEGVTTPDLDDEDDTDEDEEDEEVI